MVEIRVPPFELLRSLSCSSSGAIGGEVFDAGRNVRMLECISGSSIRIFLIKFLEELVMQFKNKNKIRRLYILLELFRTT
jgi:hypothetical protein